MRQFKGVARGIVIGALIWGLIIFVIWLISCGNSGGNESTASVTTEFTEIDRHELNDQELDWWIEVGNCLVNKGLATHDMVSAVEEPFVIIVDSQFMCGSKDDASGCGLMDRIILWIEVADQEAWFKHEACHVYDKWIHGVTNHDGIFWYPVGHESHGACLCQ